ncbi:NAD(P)H-hydrate epimerase [Undibacterium arcticum]
MYPIAQIRQIEQAAQATLAPGTLMQRAGTAAAHAALELIKFPHQQTSILVLAGPGDNGGDALESAAHLAQLGLSVSVLLHADPDKQSVAAKQALLRAQASSAKFIDSSQTNDVDAVITSTPWTLVIDGLFGIGLTRPLPDQLHQIVNTINRLHCVVLALDVPSGLDADTGNIVDDQAGGRGVAVRASHTITFIADKPGLHTCDGRDLAGQVQVARLGIDHSLFPASAIRLNHPDLFAASLQQRKHNSHKGSFGDVAVIGGALGMAGAVILAARTAAQCGAGRVFAAFLQDAPAYDSAQPELMCRRAHELDFFRRWRS